MARAVDLLFENPDPIPAERKNFFDPQVAVIIIYKKARMIFSNGKYIIQNKTGLLNPTSYFSTGPGPTSQVKKVMVSPEMTSQANYQLPHLPSQSHLDFLWLHSTKLS